NQGYFDRQQGYYHPGNVSVLLGKGDGTFNDTQTYAARESARSVAVGDFNEDGILDLAVVGFTGTVEVLLGYGNGAFQPAQSYGGVGPGVSVAVGDFDHDGHLDLAVANSSWD